MPQWSLVKELLGLALEQPVEKRAALLDQLCRGEPDLRGEVESLLHAEAEAGDFLEVPAPPEPIDPHLGQNIGPYLIDNCIGRGGMGAVYLAHRTGDFQQSVAIKMIRRGMDSDLVVRRFRHERQILASLNHPHIARLYDGGTTADGLPYFVMEHVDGARIDRYADEHRLTTADRLRLCLGVFDAVQHAHDHHVVHRDLKPANVLVTTSGEPKLLDFGIAKILSPDADGDSTLTSLARPMTPDYASPEQIRGGAMTAATDVYALGLLLYELLSGHRPFRVPSGEALSRIVCEQEPDRPSTAIRRVETTTRGDGTTETKTPQSVSETRDGTPDALRRRLTGPLDAIVMKALRKDPAARYQSAGALAEDVRRWLDGKPVSAAADAVRYRATVLLRRHRAAIGVAMLLVVAIALTAVAARRRGSEPAAAAPASSPPAPTAVAARPSVAVATFANLSGRPDDQWLSTAMAEMLATELAGDGQVRVVPSELVARTVRGLGIDAVAAASAESVERVRQALSADYLVLGSFVTSPGAGARALRVDLRLLRSPGEPLVVAGVGEETGLFAMMAETGKTLRARLGLAQSSADATESARAAFPQTLDAMRLYAQGLSRLRQLDAVPAQTLLADAATREPGNPMIQSALAAAWTALGYDTRAREAAQKAFDHAQPLNREDRLNVEGRLYDAQRESPKAIEIYRTLWGFFSDNVEYGLRLAETQIAAGRHQDALATVAELRRLPAPGNADPRIDLVESQAASGLADVPRERAALARARQRGEEIGARQLVARARLYEGRSLWNSGDPKAAVPALESARQLFLDAGDRAGAAAALNSLGTVLSDQQDITRGEKMYEESLAAAEAIGDRRAMSAALNNLGILLKDQGRLVEARRAHERSLALRREIGERNWTAISLSNIGVVLFEEDKLQEATTYYKESLAIARELGDKRQLVRSLHNLSIVERELGQLADARAGFEESLATRAAIGDKRGQVMGQVELGMVLLEQGELAAARASQLEAIRLAIETKLVPGEAQARFQLGEIALAGNDLPAARQQHEQALALRREMKETRTMLESQLALAALALEEGRPDEAEAQTAAAMRAIGTVIPAQRAFAELVLARAALARRNLPTAQRALASLRTLSAQSQRMALRAGVSMVEAEMDLAANRPAAARDRLTALGKRLTALGMVLRDLERRALLVRVDRAERRPTAARDQAALEADARARGVSLIARRLQGL